LTLPLRAAIITAMNKTKLRILCLLLVGVAFAGAADISPMLDQAAYLFFNRHLAPGNLDSAYSLLAQARALDPTNEQCLYLWSRIHVQKGDLTESKSAKLSLYYRARAIAETLMTRNDDNANAHVWWAVAHGRVGQTRGVLNSLFMIPALKREVTRALELDPENATAYDVFGVFHSEVPSFAGGDIKKSVEYLTRGIEVDPNYSLLHLDLAKTYMSLKRWAEAREQLQAVLATENPTYPADTELDDKPEAEKLLAEIKDR
jgi:tetratricopeptide (TPR) repeat protein